MLVITDFGVPKVIGGQYNVLATDIYKQVIGQQNFQMGAVVGLVLLLPAVLAFIGRPHGAAPAGGVAVVARRRLPAEAATARSICSFLRRLRADRVCHPGDAGHRVLRLDRHVLALQPHALA